MIDGAFEHNPARAVLGQRLPTNNSMQDYVDPLTNICATSNSCERLFSTAKYVLVPHRRSMSAKMFEAILLLKKNAQFWDAEQVGRYVLSFLIYCLCCFTCSLLSNNYAVYVYY